MLFGLRMTAAALVLTPSCAWAASVTDYCDTRAKSGGGFEIVCDTGEGPQVQNIWLGNYEADTFAKARGRDAKAMEQVAEFYQLVRKDYDAAIAWLRTAADAGDADAMVSLGHIYTGQYAGAPKDDDAALKWFAAAAAKGDPAGMFWAGNLNASRLHKPVDAERWYRMAAAKGSLLAIQVLANDYDGGREGFPRDPVQAAIWHRAAADAGSVYAFYQVGLDYERGTGVAQSDAAAAQWYLKGEKAGQPNALRALAQMYREGRGVAKDDAEAARLAALAEAQKLPTVVAPAAH